MATTTKTDRLHLELCHQTWHCVIDVPRSLRAAMGRKRLVRSLQTHDLTEVRKHRREVLDEFDATIKAA